MFTNDFSQDAIANFTTEHEIATAIKAKFEQQYPSTCVIPCFLLSFMLITSVLVLPGGIVSLGETSEVL